MRSFLAAIVAVASFACAAQAGQADVKPAPTAPPAAGARAGDTVKGTNRVVGGVVSKGRPFLAALLFEKDGSPFQYCGASVIGSNWLLTAAHCKVQKGDTALINRSDLSKAGGQKLTIVDVRPHPAYDAQTNDNDIAVLVTSGKISAGIPVVTRATAPPADAQRVTVAGWGFTQEGGHTVLQLREVDVPIIPSAECKQKYQALTDNMLCAGEAGKDSCQGDSGGPLFRLDKGVTTQYGIVSYGFGCARDGWPGVYTRVDQYREWIANQMR